MGLVTTKTEWIGTGSAMTSGATGGNGGDLGTTSRWRRWRSGIGEGTNLTTKRRLEVLNVNKLQLVAQSKDNASTSDPKTKTRKDGNEGPQGSAWKGEDPKDKPKNEKHNKSIQNRDRRRTRSGRVDTTTVG